MQLQKGQTQTRLAMERFTATGSVSAAMVDEITRHVESLGENLPHPTSPSVCKALRMSWQSLESGKIPQSQQWAQVALDYSWEQLNMGNWKDVSVSWREVYATAALLKALGLVRAGERQRALEELDRGILLGAPILDSALHSFATSLTASMHSNSTSATARTSSDSIPGERTDLESDAMQKGGTNSVRGERKIVFRNYKPLREHSEQTPQSKCDVVKKPRVEVDVHDLASRTHNVPLVDPKYRISLTYLPSLEAFHQNYMNTKTPVVISGAMDTWPAYSARKWRYIDDGYIHTLVLCLLYKLCIVQSGVSEAYSRSTYSSNRAGFSLH